MSVPAKRAEIGHLPVVPEQGVQKLEIDIELRVEGCANSRPPNHLAFLVDSEGEPFRISTNCRELMDIAILPRDRFELKHLRSRASQIRSGILRRARRHAEAVDFV